MDLEFLCEVQPDGQVTGVKYGADETLMIEHTRANLISC